MLPDRGRILGVRDSAHVGQDSDEAPVLRARVRAGVEAEASRLALFGALLLGPPHPPHVVVRSAHRTCDMPPTMRASPFWAFFTGMPKGR